MPRQLQRSLNCFRSATGEIHCSAAEVFPGELEQLGGELLGHRADEEEERLRLRIAQAAQVGTGTPDELPSAAAAGRRIQGDAGHGQRLQIPPGRLHRDFEFLRELGRGDLPAGLQDEQGAEETVGTHETRIRANLPMT